MQALVVHSCDRKQDTRNTIPVAREGSQAKDHDADIINVPKIDGASHSFAFCKHNVAAMAVLKVYDLNNVSLTVRESKRLKLMRKEQLANALGFALGIGSKPMHSNLRSSTRRY